jgi:phosphoserine phosphatase RsbU/P
MQVDQPNSVKRLQCMEVWGGNVAVSTAVELPGLDAWLYSRPADGADDGGDVHYASSCAAGALSRLLVADVCGHGADAAESARRLRKLMQRHIIQHEQTAFVRAMNSEFSMLARGGRFATAVSLTYDAPDNRLQICNAGHPPPLWYRAVDRTWTYLDSPRGDDHAPNFPLGIDGVADYEQFEAAVDVGDLILCYTDALPEARRSDRELLGPGGLLSLVRGITVNDLAQLITELLAAVTAAGAEVTDDLTILAIRPNGQRVMVPLHDRFLAPFRYVRHVAAWKMGDART